MHKFQGIGKDWSILPPSPVNVLGQYRITLIIQAPACILRKSTCHTIRKLFQKKSWNIKRISLAWNLLQMKEENEKHKDDFKRFFLTKTTFRNNFTKYELDKLIMVHKVRTTQVNKVRTTSAKIKVQYKRNYEMTTAKLTFLRELSF